jgi:hypothetical protein
LSVTVLAIRRPGPSWRAAQSATTAVFQKPRLRRSATTTKTGIGAEEPRSFRAGDNAKGDTINVQRLVPYCFNPSCRHEGPIDVSNFADDIEVPSFGKKVVCAKWGRAVGTSTCGQTEKSGRVTKACSIYTFGLRDIVVQ